MVALLTALGLFLASFGVHVLWWRARVPEGHLKALVIVFGLTPLLASALLLGSTSSLWRMVTVSGWVGIALFHLGATGCYLITYTGVTEDSPSLAIVRALRRAKSAGCSRDELALQITEQKFVHPRLLALQRGGFLEQVAGGKRLTARGRRAALTAVRLSRLFNIHDSV
jgi:hypothetical protein